MAQETNGPTVNTNRGASRDVKDKTDTCILRYLDQTRSSRIGSRKDSWAIVKMDERQETQKQDSDLATKDIAIPGKGPHRS